MPYSLLLAQGKYVEVLGGHDDLKEAIYTKGPMTVPVDASADCKPHMNLAELQLSPIQAE